GTLRLRGSAVKATTSAEGICGKVPATLRRRRSLRWDRCSGHVHILLCERKPCAPLARRDIANSRSPAAGRAIYADLARWNWLALVRQTCFAMPLRRALHKHRQHAATRRDFSRSPRLQPENRWRPYSRFPPSPLLRAALCRLPCHDESRARARPAPCERTRRFESGANSRGRFPAAPHSWESTCGLLPTRTPRRGCSRLFRSRELWLRGPWPGPSGLPTTPHRS